MPVLSPPKRQPQEAGPSAFGTAALLLAAIAFGSALGLTVPTIAVEVARYTDLTLLALIFLLFFELRLGAVVKAFGNLRFLTVAWVANFLIVPMLAFAIASLLLSGQPLLFAGLMIYFLAPCTDWFLGFTRMAGGDTELGAALIPVNLVSQLLLLPLWLWLFTPATGLVDFGALPGILFQWFLLPMALAQALRALLTAVLRELAFERLLGATGLLLSLTLGALIVQIFASHVGAILANAPLFGLVAVAVVLFFALSFFTGVALTRMARLSYPEHALLAMTMAARNAPLMLALTAVAIPGQPLVLAVIVFGMLVEIPHLTLLRQLLLRRSAHAALPSPT
ncbi:MAG: arsenic resistance protein [Pseudomonadota bacterium]